MTAHDCPWTDTCHCARDNAECVCGHKNVSHGSHLDGVPVAVGSGSCGFCACRAFEGDARKEVPHGAQQTVGGRDPH